VNLFCSCDGDSIGARVGQASLADEVEETRRLSKVVNDGNALFTQWALGVGGDVISAGGDEVVVQVEASHIIDLPALREQYLDLVGATVSVGVGLKLSEAQKALFVAKLEGKNRVQMYDDQVEQAFQRAREHFLAEDSAEVEKLGNEYLNTQDDSQRHDLNKGEDEAPNEKQLLDDAEAPHDEAKKPAKKDWEQEFHAAAKRSGKDQGDQKKQADIDQLKQKVGGVLQTLRGQLGGDGAQKLAAKNPELYNAVNEMVQSMVEMGQTLFAKSEDLDKACTYPACGAPTKGTAIFCSTHSGKPPQSTKKASSDEQLDIDEPEVTAKTGPEGEIAPQKTQPAAEDELEKGLKTKIAGALAAASLFAGAAHGLKPATEGAKQAVSAVQSRTAQADAINEKGEESEVEKAALDPGKTGRHNVILPVGSVKTPGPGGDRDVGKLKVEHASGKAGWQGVRAGLVGSPTGRPTSARNPGGAPQDKPGVTPEHYSEDEAQPS